MKAIGMLMRWVAVPDRGWDAVPEAVGRRREGMPYVLEAASLVGHPIATGLRRTMARPDELR